MRRGLAGGALELTERDDEVGEIFFKDGEKEFEAALEVDVDGGLGAAGLRGDGAGGDSGEALGAEMLFGCGEYLRAAAGTAACGLIGYGLFCLLPHGFSANQLPAPFNSKRLLTNLPDAEL